jgi:hypothetical protein
LDGSGRSSVFNAVFLLVDGDASVITSALLALFASNANALPLLVEH